jgi:hypothetical protein
MRSQEMLSCYLKIEVHDLKRTITWLVPMSNSKKLKITARGKPDVANPAFRLHNEEDHGHALLLALGALQVHL